MARKGHYLYKLYFPRTNFLFPLQTLFSSYKLYFPPTNFIFLLQTLFSWHKLYSNRTNFIITVQTLLSSYKLYFLVQTLLSSYKLYFLAQTLLSSYKLCHSRKELIRKESGNERKYFKMAEDEGDERDVIEHYFHLGYTNEIILEFLKRFHHIKISLRTLKRRLRSFGLRRKGNIMIDEARIRAVIIRELSGPGRLQGYRSMWHTLRIKCNLHVPSVVAARLVPEIDPSASMQRRRRRLPRRQYFSYGPNFCWHVDGR